ncbi:MAG: spore cortex-lytic enzyme [Firmicutes bacterium]|nr:spore cortex-lytic enzyme [Bacillota bacterium]
MRRFIRILLISTVFISMNWFNPVSASGYYYSEGDQGTEVAAINSKLRQAGFRAVAEGPMFTAKTATAVKAFQKNHKLIVTGIVEDKTYQALMNKTMPEDKAMVPKAKAVINTSFEYLGVPYRYGGTTPRGFDCSGFVQYVYKKHGITLPRTADIQYKSGAAVARKQLRAGDMVFFSTTDKGVSHSGIYLGDNKFISATSSRGIAIRSMSDPYWQPRYLGARRILQ